MKGEGASKSSTFWNAERNIKPGQSKGTDRLELSSYSEVGSFKAKNKQQEKRSGWTKIVYAAI
jgi:hypothetical protein